MSKESAGSVEGTKSGEWAKARSFSRRIYLRYPDGVPAMWVTNNGDDAILVKVPDSVMFDISAQAKVDTKFKSEDVDDKRKLYNWKRQCTLLAARYAIRQYIFEDDKWKMRDPYRWTTPDGSSALIVPVPTSDYHGDMIIPKWKMTVPNAILVHCVRFGHDEKILLRGWTTMKSFTQLCSSFSKPRKEPSAFFGKMTMEFFSLPQEELLPIELLKGEKKTFEESFGI